MGEAFPGESELVWEEFHQIVNMTSDELRAVLTAEVSEGPRDLGAQVAEVLHKRKADLTGADTEVMRQVVDFVEDRLEEDPADKDGWRRSLMTVGHDPFR
ncbi:DUF3140 domain-containing protein [Actinomadura barringtoniae]|uniref:DUF3140 domain-containing protein n=1 Tax=Actinomadura barringtoniae TaxID=1427535 RepID=A0A939PPT5_9ACTN|nr:DUF3140 domain-containing protein [Actinomadura barringtoniae]MBO2452989.1 DUF3140 domain-containing protein [Actinomadura barringtoniae]